VIGGRVLDTSTLVDFALVRPYPQALVWTAVDAGMVLAIPATALAEAWARTPLDAQDALAVLLALPNTVVEPLDAAHAQMVGQMLSARSLTRTGAGPVTDQVRAGHVATCGLRRGWPVVTGEASALRELDPGLDVDELP
jgi:hypothetical protein